MASCRAISVTKWYNRDTTRRNIVDILIPLAGLVGSLALSSVLLGGLADLVYKGSAQAERSRRAEERARAELRAHVRALAKTSAGKRNRGHHRPQEVSGTGLWLM